MMTTNLYAVTSYFVMYLFLLSEYAKLYKYTRLRIEIGNNYLADLFTNWKSRHNVN